MRVNYSALEYTLYIVVTVLFSQVLQIIQIPRMIVIMKMIRLGYDLDSGVINELIYYHCFSVTTVIFGLWVSLTAHCFNAA